MRKRAILKWCWFDKNKIGIMIFRKVFRVRVPMWIASIRHKLKYHDWLSKE